MPTHVCRSHWRSEESVGSPGTRVHCGYLESKCGLLGLLYACSTHTYTQIHTSVHKINNLKNNHTYKCLIFQVVYHLLYFVTGFISHKYTHGLCIYCLQTCPVDFNLEVDVLQCPYRLGPTETTVSIPHSPFKSHSLLRGYPLPQWLAGSGKEKI